MMKKLIPKNKIELTQFIEDHMKQYGNDCDLTHIDVSLIEDMAQIFYHYKDFNGNISNWNVRNVKNMSQMFDSSQFNGNISQWDVGNVKNMNLMFLRSSFKGNLSQWKPTSVKFLKQMFTDCAITLPYWYSDNPEEVQFFLQKQQLNKNLQIELPLHNIIPNIKL